MKNRRSALEARKRQKQKEEQLHTDYEKLTNENFKMREENKQLQLLIKKYLRNIIQF